MTPSYTLLSLLDGTEGRAVLDVLICDTPPSPPDLPAETTI
jgi:hypothetical protein